MINFYDDKKFEAAKYRHEDQSKLLQVMSTIDLKVIISFFTLQLLLGGFFAKTFLDLHIKIGFALIDVALSLVCISLLFNNYQRRKEVVGTIKNCNDFLMYTEKGFYIEGESLNSNTKFRAWFGCYLIAIIFGLVGTIMITFSNNTPNKSQEKKINSYYIFFNN